VSDSHASIGQQCDQLEDEAIQGATACSDETRGVAVESTSDTIISRPAVSHKKHTDKIITTALDNDKLTQSLLGAKFSCAEGL